MGPIRSCISNGPTKRVPTIYFIQATPLLSYYFSFNEILYLNSGLFIYLFFFSFLWIFTTSSKTILTKDSRAEQVIELQYYATILLSLFFFFS